MSSSTQEKTTQTSWVNFGISWKKGLWEPKNLKTEKGNLYSWYYLLPSSLVYLGHYE